MMLLEPIGFRVPRILERARIKTAQKSSKGANRPINPAKRWRPVLEV